MENTLTNYHLGLFIQFLERKKRRRYITLKFLALSYFDSLGV